VYGVLVLPCTLASPDVNLKRNAELRDRIGNGEATSTVFADFKNIFSMLKRTIIFNVFVPQVNQKYTWQVSLFINKILLLATRSCYK